MIKTGIIAIMRYDEILETSVFPDLRRGYILEELSEGGAYPCERNAFKIDYKIFIKFERNILITEELMRFVSILPGLSLLIALSTICGETEKSEETFVKILASLSDSLLSTVALIITPNN